MKPIKLILIFFISYVLISCGFHLRGEAVLPSQLQTLYLQSNNPYGSFTKSLRRSLIASNVTLVASAAEANYTLRILSEMISTTSATVSSSTNVKSNRLSLAVSYAIYDKKGQAIVGPATVTTQQTVTLNTTQLLGASHEQQQTEEEMRRNAVGLLMSRLAAPQTVQQLEKTVTEATASSHEQHSPSPQKPHGR